MTFKKKSQESLIKPKVEAIFYTLNRINQTITQLIKVIEFSDGTIEKSIIKEDLHAIAFAQAHQLFNQLPEDRKKEIDARNS